MVNLLNRRTYIECDTSPKKRAWVDVTIDNSTPVIPPYRGPYEVIPTVDGMTLQTKNLRMDDNVTIHEIPYYEVSNPTGGITVYIADGITVE